MKKSIRVLIIAALCIIFVAGCAKTEAKPKDNTVTEAGVTAEVTTEADTTATNEAVVAVSETAVSTSESAINLTDLMGSMEGDVYSNPYFGMKVTYPKEWVDVRELTAKTYEQQGVTYSTPMIVAASVDPSTNPESLGIISLEAIEKKLFVYPIKDIDGYYTFIKQQMESLKSDDVEVTVTEAVVTQHTKVNTETFKVVLNVKSENVTQTILYIIGETEDYFLLGNFMYTAEADRPSVEAIYNSVVFE